MKLKLTKVEFNALLVFFEMMIVDAKPEGMSSKMLHSILCEVYEKFYKKAIRIKPKYTIQLKEHEAIGFWFFFQKYQFDSELVFETNLVHKINNSIHQKYSL
jgi:hypothetical protein